MLVLGSHTGLIGVKAAYEALVAGASPLDAVVAGATAVEDDPNETSVGYGGIPNEDGVVELDAAVMDGPTHRGGAVAALKNVRHPTQVARLVMQQTNRVLLAGEGALRFARANGFVEENLLTDHARRVWLHWKRTHSDRDDWRGPAEDEIAGDEPVDPAVLDWFARHYRGPAAHKGGTVHIAALDARGDLACATSTSGHPFKIPGRVGDSPILGAGLYVDNEVGSCGSLGHGEANLENCSSFAAVELMRQGASPLDAGMEILRRIARNAHPWQLGDKGEPQFNLWLYLLHKDGRTASVTLRGSKQGGPKQFALADNRGVRMEECVALFG
jgi:N4-(beta-N-acetylglucosaminyl)-L-asparaginase